MRQLIIKTSFFVIPFFLIHSFNLMFFNNQEGDLVRVGYIYNNPMPKSLIDEQFDLNKKYTLLSEIDFSQPQEFDVLVIGDSFSDQGNLSYHNFLANKGISVLYIDEFIPNKKPIQTLIGLLNSSFFDTIKVKHIILQSVEREFNNRTAILDFEQKLNLEELNIKIDKYLEQLEHHTPKNKLRFFSEALLKIPLNNMSYQFTKKPKYSRTYKIDIEKENLFSNKTSDLLFYDYEIDYLNIKNDTSRISKSVKMLNKLEKIVNDKEMDFIFILSPDKYDVYYEFIKDKIDNVEPTFFKQYEQLKKTYTEIKSFQILKKALNTTTNLYYYDDSHWSPYAAKLIGEEVYKTLNL